MILYLPIAWLTGFEQAALALAILVLLIQRELNMVTKIWLSFITAVPSTAFFVRIRVIRKDSSEEGCVPPLIWLRLWINRLRVSVILAEIPLPISRIPSIVRG